MFEILFCSVIFNNFKKTIVDKKKQPFSLEFPRFEGFNLTLNSEGFNPRTQTVSLTAFIKIEIFN